MKIVYLPDNPVVIRTLAQWHHQQWAYLNPGDSVDRRIADLRTHLGSRQIPVTFVALSGNTVLGSASLIANDMDTRRDLSPWLASLYVAPEHRNTGVGTALVQRALEQAKGLPVKTLYLFTPDREGFYARLGWSPTQRTAYRGEKVLIMTYDFAG